MNASAYVPDPREATSYPVLPGGDLGSGGSGGSGEQEVYLDRAPSPPDNPAMPALNYVTGGSSTQQWDVATQAWV